MVKSNYDEAVSVGALERDGSVARFSSFERVERDRSVPDLIAPGGDIESALPGGGYQSMSGTSMAAPHISGLAALLMEAASDATEDEVEDAIFQSCSELGQEDPNSFGHGVPDAVEALRRVRA